MRKYYLVFLLSIFSVQGNTMSLCPDGSYVSGNSCRLTPNGTYISSGGNMNLCPDGSYVSGGGCRLTPNGTYISSGGNMNLCPDGSYSSGECRLAPNGGYVGTSSRNQSQDEYYYGYKRKYGGVGAAAAYQAGYLFGSSLNGSRRGNATGVSLNSLFTSSDKWKCPAGSMRDLADGCVKGFVANLNDGIDAYAEGDYKTAIQHWELLANNGSANAQFYIGRMYEKGVYFPKNDYWAVHWITKAAELGLPDAEYTLGYIYRNGAGVVKDINQTVKWFKKAGKKGHNKAQFNLGAMYINGDGVNKSMKEAKYWINLAINNGHLRAEDVWNDFELSKY
jgi:TPR repeat protein